MSVEFVFILPISIGLQFVAAYLAFRLIRTATGGPAWAFVAAALFLMGVSSSVSFYQMLESGADHAVRVAELVALLISALMVVGMALIGPLFSATRRAERRLRQSERRTRSIEGQLDDAIESISEGFALFDADGRLIICNSRYKEFYGYADADAPPGVHTRDLGLLDLERGTVIHQGESSGYLDRRESDRQFKDTFIIHLKDGRILESRDRRTTSGGVVSVQEDVTERKQAEEALSRAYAELEQRVQERTQQLRESEERLISAIENIADGFVLYDEDDRLLLCNERYRNMYPNSYDLIVPGAKFEDITRIGAERGEYPDAIGRVGEWMSERLKARNSNEIFQKEYLIGDRWVRVYDKNLPNGMRVGVRVDITNEKREEAELKKLSHALEQSPSMIFITDVEGYIEYVNSMFTTLSGYAADEVIGKNLRLLKSGETPPGIYADLWRTIKSGHEWRGELKDRRKDGSMFWAYATISPVKNGNGEITNFVSMHEDITQRKSTELREHQAKEQAELASRAKSELMANMSHVWTAPCWQGLF